MDSESDWSEIEVAASNESNSSSPAHSSRSSLSTSTPRWQSPSPIPSPPPVSTIDVESLPRHVYAPQPPSVDAIRLVRLRAMDPERPGVPVCSLETAWLDLHPPYCALSYSWGLPEDIDNIDAGDEWLTEMEAEYNEANLYIIVLDGQMFGVRRNLLEFLVKMSRELADPGFVGYDLFWIDAICINQEDLRERNRQVSMMGAIYQEADRVLVWLGADERGEMDDVKDMVQRVLAMSENILRESKRIHLSPSVIWQRHIDQQQFLADVGLPPFESERWWPFCAFFRRSWYFRLWVMQEVAIAKQIVMLCGDTEFEIIDLDDCGLVLRSGLDLQLGEKWAVDRFSRFRPVGRTLHRVCQILRWCQLKEEPYPGEGGSWIKTALNGTSDTLSGGAVWNVLLHITEGAKCQEAVDKVFALIGIVQHLAPQAKIPVVVDYSEMEREMQLAMMKYIIGETEWLNALCRVIHIKGQICIPSWTPRFIRPISYPIFIHAPFNATLSLSGNTMSPDLPMFRFINHAQLFTAATRVDMVSMVDKEFKHMSVDATEELALLLVGCDKTYKSTTEMVSRAVWKSLVVWPDADNGLSEEADRIGKSFHSHLLFQYASGLADHAMDHFDFDTERDLKGCLLEELTTQYPNIRDLAEQLSDPGLPSPNDIVNEIMLWGIAEESRKDRKWQDRSHRIHKLYAETHEYRLLAGKHTFLRRFFRTEGGYVGLGPDAARPGDELWLIPRMTVPVVLRRVYNDIEVEDVHDDYTSPVEHEQEEYARETPLYVIVGEAYVHGIMHGEYIKQLRANAVQAGSDWHWQNIVIK